MADKDKAKVDLGLLEEDDEFEEFPAEGEWRYKQKSEDSVSDSSGRFPDWAGTKEEDEEELSVWEDNWDDDNVEDDFNQQLRAQLEKQKKMDISKK